MWKRGVLPPQLTPPHSKIRVVSFGTWCHPGHLTYKSKHCHPTPVSTKTRGPVPATHPNLETLNMYTLASFGIGIRRSSHLKATEIFSAYLKMWCKDSAALYTIIAHHDTRPKHIICQAFCSFFIPQLIQSLLYKYRRSDLSTLPTTFYRINSWNSQWAVTVIHYSDIKNVQNLQTS